MTFSNLFWVGYHHRLDYKNYFCDDSCINLFFSFEARKIDLCSYHLDLPARFMQLPFGVVLWALKTTSKMLNTGSHYPMEVFNDRIGITDSMIIVFKLGLSFFFGFNGFYAESTLIWVPRKYVPKIGIPMPKISLN